MNDNIEKENIEAKPIIKKSENILTKKEINKEGQDNASPVKNEKKVEKKIEVKKPQDIDVKFECGFALAGDSTVAFRHEWEGKEYRYELELKNKIFILPKDLSKEDKRRYRAALKANNFMDVTVIEAGASFDAEKKQYVYSVMHPEHTSRNRINGTISLVLLDDAGRPMFYAKGEKKGQQITEQVTIIEGKVKTDNPLVYEALLRTGFYSAGKIEKEE